MCLWLIIISSGLDLFMLLQLHLITITYKAHNRWLPKTHSISSWTMSTFSFTVTNSLLVWSGLVWPFMLHESDRTHCVQRFQYCCSCMHCVGNVLNSVVSVRWQVAVIDMGFRQFKLYHVSNLRLSEVPSNNGPLQLSGVMSQYY
jgi:hypothetical protein